MKVSGIKVVLVEPQGPLNIGSICRSMMNFGVSCLRLVNPCRRYNGRESRKMALKAESIIDSASVYTSLYDAVADCHFVVGTTRRYGKYRDHCMLPEHAAEKISVLDDNCLTAFVFGREDCGLLTEELDLCQALVTIPTNEEFMSMNLAQAVTICLYEINRCLEPCKSSAVKRRGVEPCENEQLEAMFQHMRDTFTSIGYANNVNPDHILRTFRQILGRTTLSERDVRVFHGLLSRMDWIENQRQKLIKTVKDGGNV